jgi:hypothetical protein
MAVTFEPHTLLGRAGFFDRSGETHHSAPRLSSRGCSCTARLGIREAEIRLSGSRFVPTTPGSGWSSPGRARYRVQYDIAHMPPPGIGVSLFVGTGPSVLDVS